MEGLTDKVFAAAWDQRGLRSPPEPPESHPTERDRDDILFSCISDLEMMLAGIRVERMRRDLKG